MVHSNSRIHLWTGFVLGQKTPTFHHRFDIWLVVSNALENHKVTPKRRANRRNVGMIASGLDSLVLHHLKIVLFTTQTFWCRYQVNLYKCVLGEMLPMVPNVFSLAKYEMIYLGWEKPTTTAYHQGKLAAGSQSNPNSRRKFIFQTIIVWLHVTTLLYSDRTWRWLLLKRKFPDQIHNTLGNMSMNRKSTAEQVGFAVTCYLFVYVGRDYLVY